MLPLPYCAVIDAASAILLTLGLRPPIIAFLVRSEPDVEFAHNVNYPNYLKEFPIASGSLAKFPEWRWDKVTRKFTPTPKELVTDSIRYRSALAVKKSLVLFEMMRMLEAARFHTWSGLIMQENIYLTKRIQAQKFKDTGYPESEASQYSYVLQYAELSGLSPQAAADEILFKAHLADDDLAKSERIRLRFFKMVREATDISQLPAILETFRTEVYLASI